MTAKPRKEADQARRRIEAALMSSCGFSPADRDRVRRIIENTAIRPVADPLAEVLERWDKMSLVIDSAMARETILDPRAQHHAEIVSVLIHDTRAALAAYREDGK